MSVNFNFFFSNYSASKTLPDIEAALGIVMGAVVVADDETLP
jgi:hypothetical protein